MKLNSLEQLEMVKEEITRPKSLLDKQGALVWLDKNKKQTRIKDMNLNYIKNLINHIHRSKGDYWFGYNRSEWLKALNNWLIYRNKQLDVNFNFKQLKINF